MKHDPAVKNEIAFFNQRAETWMELWRQNPRAIARGFYAREFRRLFRLAALRPADVILDVGCGSGVLAPYILRRLGPRGRLHELDYADQMIAVNRRLHPDRRIRFHVADVHELPLPARSCHGVFCFSCFPHFYDKPRALRAMSRVLKSGGWLIIAHFDSPRDLNRHHAGSDPAVRHAHLPDGPGMRALLQGTGLMLRRHINDPGFYAVIAARE